MFAWCAPVRIKRHIILQYLFADVTKVANNAQTDSSNKHTNLLFD